MVLLKLEALLPDYVRVEKEVNKELLLAARHDEQVAPLLPALGVMVSQSESFFIELKKEEVTAS
jgi:phage host-nuclease inhibitor protein Gam